MIRSLLLAGTCVLLLPVCAAAQATTLQPFRSDAEIAEFHQRLAEERERRLANIPPMTESELMNSGHRYSPPIPGPTPPAGTPRQQERPVSREWEIPSAQQTGGDPRETVGVAADHVVVLRRGRLFTVRAGRDTLQALYSVDAAGFPVRLYTQYDELLVIGEHVVVIGSSMQRNGTELGVFHVAPDGRLTHRGTYSFTSGDRIAWHTYAARVTDGRLVLYAPLVVRGRESHRPALHRWTADEDSSTHSAPATRVYRPAGHVAETDQIQLHTVAVCDLAGDGGLRCELTGVYAPPGRGLYVSSTAAYVWTAQADSREHGFVLYRLPLDGSAPTALRVLGTPTDPSSFMESADGHLQVLVRTSGEWARMGGGVASGTGLALLRVPLSEFGDGSRPAARERYRAVPAPEYGELKGGYVGDWLIYGTGARPAEQVTRSTAVALRWADGGGVSRISLPHAVERVQALGTGALLVGGDGDSLHLSTLRLGRDTAVLADRHAVPGSNHLAFHGVFYRADGADAGVLAVPVRGPERPQDAPWLYGPGAVRFLRNRGLRLEQMGEIAAGAYPGDDACMRGCRNWFGDTRPLFLRGRIMALLGYEVVEARQDGGRIRELRRAGFAPAHPTADLSGEWSFYEDIGAGSGGRYSCRNRGTMHFDRDGDSLAVRWRQTGECRIDGVTSRSDGEGGAVGTVFPYGVVFQSGPCRYQGSMNTLNSFDGRMECRIPMADGSTLDVHGWWRARRDQP